MVWCGVGCIVQAVYSMEVEEATATAATTTAAAATVIAAASLECSRGASGSASEHSPDVTAVDTGGSSDVSLLLPSGATVAAAGRAGAGVVSSSAVAVAVAVSVGSIMHGWVPSNALTDRAAVELVAGVTAAVSEASMTPADTGEMTGATGTAPVPVVEVGAAGRGRGRVGEGRGFRPAFMRAFIAFKSFVLAHSAHTHAHTHTHTQKDIN